MNTQTTMRTVNNQTRIKTESIPEDIFSNETMEQYLIRIGAKNNTPKNETFRRFDRDD